MFIDGSGGGAMSAAVEKAVEASRSSGVLNLRGYDIDHVPSAVYDPSKIETNWWEVAELVQVVLSFNQIVQLPSELGDVVSITMLDLSHNNLEDLPRSLSQLSHLKSLDISHNRICELPTDLECLSSLVQVLCTNNLLTTLPPGLGSNQPNLAKLMVSENALTQLPDKLSSCRSLTVLDAQKNNLETVTLGTLTSLVDVNLSHNKLSSILPGDINGLHKLKVLNIQYNQLTSLPGMAHCRSLVELHAGFNRLKEIPSDMGEMEALKVLDLSTNNISSIPIAACQMRLSVLDLSNNTIGTLPPELGFMTSLRKLPLEGNPIRSIRRELITGPTESLLQALQMRMPDGAAGGSQRPVSVAHHAQSSSRSFGGEKGDLAADVAHRLSLVSRGGKLLLNGAGLAELPQQVWDAMPSLERLDLSNNKIAVIPAEAFHEASHLQILTLNSMGLTAWPLPVHQGLLPNLLTLSVARNPVSSIPGDAFTSCAATLVELDLSGLQAAGNLPDGVLGRLQKLQLLSMNRVQLRDLPRDLLKMPSLTTLDLSDNTIATIPESITQLTNLKVLNLANNSIVDVPPQMGLMHPTLRTFVLEGNILKRLRRNVLEKGTSSILQYLRDRIPV
eukprot:evm.model.scf_741.3 EVM.evm.TU.scf_741.3   scf_741:61361-66874(+)